MLQSCRYPVGLCCRAAGIPVRPAGSGRGTRRFFHWLCWSSRIRCVPVSVCLLLCVSVLILLSVLVVMVLYNVALYSKYLKAIFCHPHCGILVLLLIFVIVVLYNVALCS